MTHGRNNNWPSFKNHGRVNLVTVVALAKTDRRLLFLLLYY